MFNEMESEKKTVMTTNGPEVVTEPFFDEMENKWIKVYFVEDKREYYVDVFAAYELGFISYTQATNYYDRGGKYFLLTPEQYEMILRKFEDRIIVLTFANGIALDNYNLIKDNKIDFYGMEKEEDYIYEKNEVSNLSDNPKYETFNDLSSFKDSDFNDDFNHINRR